MTKKKGPEQHPTRILVYKGVVEAKGGRLYHVYYSITQEQFDSGKLTPGMVLASEPLWFTKRFNHARPGIILSIEHEKDDPGKVFRNTAKTMEYMPDDVCAEWAADSGAIETANKVMKNIKKEGKRDLSMEVLEPLRLAYWKLRTRNERAAFLARMHMAVTSAKSLR